MNTVSTPNLTFLQALAILDFSISLWRAII